MRVGTTRSARRPSGAAGAGGRGLGRPGLPRPASGTGTRRRARPGPAFPRAVSLVVALMAGLVAPLTLARPAVAATTSPAGATTSATAMRAAGADPVRLSVHDEETGDPAPAAVETPAADPAAGTYYGPQDITLSSATEDATLYWTTDGSTPSVTNGKRYTGPVRLGASATLKAVAVTY